MNDETTENITDVTNDMTDEPALNAELPQIIKGKGTNEVTLDVDGLSLQLVFQNKEMAREYTDTIRQALAS